MISQIFDHNNFDSDIDIDIDIDIDLSYIRHIVLVNI